MKIALAYAPSEQQFIPVPPLGIAVLGSYLREKGVPVDTLDFELELWLSRGGSSSEFAQTNSSLFEILDDVYLTQLADKLLPYDIVCFSLMGARQLPYTKYIVQQLKKHKKDRTIIIGGALLTDENAFEILEAVSGKYAIIGEGWNALYQTIKNITFNNNDDSIQVTEEDGRYAVKNKAAKDPLHIPMADYSDININGYIEQQKKLYKLNYNAINYQLLVGDRCCPYNCSFCRISKNTDKIKSAKTIADEMITLNKLYNCKNFSLICNEMNPTRQFILDFANYLKMGDNHLNWFCYLRPNNLSKDDIGLLRDAGCIMARYGVESGSQKILDNMNKRLNVDEIEQVLRDAHSAGIWNHINIITGYLYETDDDIFQTLEFIRRNQEFIDSVRVNPFFIPINSPIHLQPEKFNISINKNTGSHIIFDQENSVWEDKKQQIKDSTDIILSECIKLGIGFAGILPNLVATALAYFEDKEQAKEWLRSNHAYLWQPLSPDTAKWRLAHPDIVDIEINPWSNISGERGDNYKTRLI